MPTPGLSGSVCASKRSAGDRPEDGVEPDWHWGLLDGRLPFAFCGAMLRLAAVRDVGGYDEGVPVAEDLQLAYRLAGVGARFGVVDEVLVDYRLHPGSTTTQFDRKRSGTCSGRSYVGCRIGWQAVTARLCRDRSDRPPADRRVTPQATANR